MTTVKTNEETLTRKKMLDALEELLLTKNIEEIAVQDITEKADVGKGSFYRYFSSPYEAQQILICKKEAVCWKKMLQYYSCISTGTFSQKIMRMAINLTAYVNSSIYFQKIVGENASWYEYFSEADSSDPDSREFIEDLNTYAEAAGISQEQAKMNLHLLLTNTARYVSKAINNHYPLTFEETRAFVRKTSGQLFPEKSPGKTLRS
ncbi:MAG: TetR/AcrR family transcriptional regulator [Solobacterium sp.]|nr:TetR/AcrR family transcriptional regulator [Solobacterium sp.]